MKKTLLGRYELIEEIGRGGMSTVFRAEDRSLGREVAVKLLHPHLAMREESCLRFVREAQSIARLHHPNIVEIFDFSDSEPKGGDRFIVMELVQGSDLKKFLRKHSLNCPELGAALAYQICSALEHAHENNIIHRDIKPENILVDCVEGTLKLTDFGIAHVLDVDTMTATGSLLGSPAHMPPEMIDGEAVDFRGDIFSLGTVLYFLLTDGVLPFEGKTPSALLRNILEVRFLPPEQQNPRIGKGLARLVKRCLERDRENRYQNISELKEALRVLLSRAGVETPDITVHEFITRPVEFASEFEETLVERLVKNARQAMKKGALPRAIDDLNRILIYRPQHPQALALLDQLQANHRRKWIFAALVLCSLLLGISYILIGNFNETIAEAEVNPSIEEELLLKLSLAERSAAGGVGGVWAGAGDGEGGGRAANNGDGRTLQPGETLSFLRHSPRRIAERLTPLLKSIFAQIESPSGSLVPLISSGSKLLTRWPGAIRRPSAQANHWLSKRISALPKAKKRPRRRIIRTVKKPSSSQIKKVVSALVSETPKNPNTESASPKTPEAPPVIYKVRYQVFPFNTRVSLGKTHHGVGIDGFITVPLTEGKHRLKFSCGPRCFPFMKEVIISKESPLEQTITKPLKLKWRNALITVELEKHNPKKVYVMYRIGTEAPRTLKINSNISAFSVPFKGVGSRRTVEVGVFKHKETKIESMKPSALMNAAAESRKIQVSPNETVPLRF